MISPRVSLNDQVWYETNSGGLKLNLKALRVVLLSPMAYDRCLFRISPRLAKYVEQLEQGIRLRFATGHTLEALPGHVAIRKKTRN